MVINVLNYFEARNKIERTLAFPRKRVEIDVIKPESACGVFTSSMLNHYGRIVDSRDTAGGLGKEERSVALATSSVEDIPVESPSGSEYVAAHVPSALVGILIWHVAFAL